MCGILGIVAAEHVSEEARLSIIRRMGFWQFHRGPDGWGQWSDGRITLGHNRLAILDIPHGKQPMASVDGAIQVVFNGEIYNFQQLRRDLSARGHVFRSDHSDTEVIIYGYAEWGDRVFEHLEGMFAIGIWDQRTQRLLLGRDRLGIKPLYFSQTPQGFVFASEPKAILASGWLAPELNVEELPNFFMFRAPTAPKTLLRGLEKLPAGCWCAYSAGAGLESPRSYWDVPEADERLTDVRTATEEVERVLTDAVTSHAVADVPLGLFLSGGVDSSLLAALLSKNMHVDAFTVGTQSHLDESTFAAAVAAHLDLPAHLRVVSAEDFFAKFDAWSYYNDDPVSDPSALALMILAEHAREHGMKVMLAGEGSDEIFGGYYSYLRYGVFASLARARVGHVQIGQYAARPLRPFMRPVETDYLDILTDLHFFGTAHVLQKNDRLHLLDGDYSGLMRDWEGRVFPENDGNNDPIRSAMHFDQKVRLPNDLLSRTDRATMAHSLETRVPFLDRAVVELANRLDSSMRVRLVPPQGKPLLKRLAATYLPRDTIYRRKRGFDLPIQTWLAYEFREYFHEFMAERSIPALNYAYLKTVYDDSGGKHRAQLLWAWLVLECWYRLWIGARAVPPAPNVVADEAAYRLLRSAAA